MPKTPFFIHIGTWKTGSSTIQFNLHTVKSRLEEEGLFYMSKGDKMVIDDEIIRGFRSLEWDYINASRSKLKSIIESKRKNNRAMRFIASAEEFSGDPFTAFDNAGEVARNLFEITRDLDLDIKIIVYLRRQDDFIESMYTQSIHLGGTKTFEEFLHGYEKKAFDWYTFLILYAEVFGKENIIVRRYHKSFLPSNDSLIHQMGEILESETLRSFTSTNPRNRGLSRDALEITRITNSHLNQADQYLLRSIFQETNSKQPFESYAYFGANERMDFMSDYEESNARIASEFLNLKTERLFPDDYSGEQQNYQGLSVEAVALNLSKGLVSLNKRLVRIEEDLRYEIISNTPMYKFKAWIKKLIGREF